METARNPLAGPEAVEGIGWVWVLLFGVTLAVPTAVAVLDGELSESARLSVAVVAVAYAGWFWVVLGRVPDRWGEPGRGILFCTGAVVAVAVLASLHPMFVVALYGLYPVLFVTLGWWALGPVVAATGLVGWRTDAWEDGTGAVVNLLAVISLAVGIAAAMEAVEAQSRRRRDALDALSATRTELAEASRRAGTLEERERLAREIHDTVAQALTSVVTQLEAAEQALDGRPDEARRHLSVARGTARQGLSEVRRAVAALRPDLLERHTLGEALQRRAERWSAETGVLAMVRTSGAPLPLHPDVETALLRTTEEALANVARHAGATRATITLSYLGDAVTLDVDDDGVGFAAIPDPCPDGGFGLRGLKERLAAVGGWLEVESTPGEGTTVVAQVPS